ncbi:MAG: DUF4173 domain-containing protein [Chloroflexota bacterium]|nr:DUF4173 domain-containing protein [Chloroflexota bacterium]
MRHPYKTLYWILAIVAAVSFDRLFWENPIGINFFLFVLLALLGGLIPLWLEKVKVPWTSYLLLAPLAFFALMAAFRAEPLTNLMNGLITVGSAVLFTVSLRSGAWPQFNLRDHLAHLFRFFLNCFAGGIRFFSELHKDPAEEGPDTPAPEKKQKPLAPYLRGLLIALPVLFVLASLLASADPVFGNRLAGLFNWFEFDNLGEYLFRLIYILIIAYLLLGAYFFSLVESAKSEPKNNPNEQNSGLGLIESSVVLGAVNLLFLVFVVLQFTYLFGGTENISVEGFTYAEYARRGFFELLAVALISLGLYYLLSMVTPRAGKRQRWLFSALGLLLVAQVGVILASALTRLGLYESAYGFTRLRTMTHFAIPWLALLLAAAAGLELTRKMARMPLAVILFLFGFGLTVNILNVDAFITRQNITRAEALQPNDDMPALDTGYLVSLSSDAVPPLAAAFIDPDTPDELRDSLGGVLACRLADLSEQEPTPWTAWHASRARAASLLKNQADTLSAYPVSLEEGWRTVEINGETIPCIGDRLPFD